MTLQHIITRVRRVLDQVPFSNENNVLDSHVLGSPETAFSDENLIDRINNAIRVIISRVKASHVPETITAYTGDLDNIAANVVRVLPHRIFRNDGTADIRCVRRSVDSNRRLQKSGRNASDEYPVFTYEDGELKIYPVPVAYTAWTVQVPDALTLGNLTDDLPLDERFELALVMYVVATCYQTMQNTDLMDYAMSVFEDEIEPFGLDVRYGLINDRENDVE